MTETVMSDPALPAMTMDMLSKVLGRADRPADMGTYLAEEIRALTGVRCVFFVQYLAESASTGYRVVSVNPERRRRWSESAGFRRLCEITRELDSIQSWSPVGTAETAAILAQAGLGLSMAIPLKVGVHRVGVMLLLGFPDEAILVSTRKLLATLSTVLALVLRNAFLYEHQEQIIEERTAELSQANEQLRTELAERQRMEEAIHEQQQMLELILENALAGYWDWMLQENSEYLSPMFKKMFGYSDDELPNRPESWQRIIFQEDLSGLLEQLQRHIQSGGTVPFYNEVRYHHKDGSTAWVICVGKVIQWDEQQRPVRMIGCHIDITQRKQAEAELQTYREHLEELVSVRTVEMERAKQAAEVANQAKSRFLATMSHELRTPLNAILGFSALLRRNQDIVGPDREHLDIINRSGEHLLGLINDILDMAKIEAGQLQLQIAPFDLGDLVNDIAGMMGQRAAEKHLELRLERSARVVRYIRGDEGRLRQIVINLLANAIKFTQQGVVTLRLDALSEPNGLRLRIEVEDSGPGITPEDQARVFDPFFQSRQTAVTHKGTGLGLPITRQFVELMGGQIGVISQPGQGSCFWIELPIETVTGSEVIGQRGEEGGEVLGLEAGQPNFRILVAEDQPESALLLKNLLEGAGFQVRIAEDGLQAVEQFQTWQPNLIWMDWRMPEMDGLEASRRIRRLAGGHQVKIIALTASVFAEQCNEILAAGMDGILHKPFYPDELFECMAQQLGVRYRRQSSALLPEAATVATNKNSRATVPNPLRQELAEALLNLNIDRIDALIGQVAQQDAETGQRFRRYADGFAYERIETELRSGA